MTQHARGRMRVEALDEMQVTVAQPGKGRAQQDFAGAGLGQRDFLDRQLLVCGVKNGGFHGVSCASGGGSRSGRLSTSIYPGRPAFINPPGISRSSRSPLVRAGTVRSNDGDGPSVGINLFVLALARRDRYFSDDPP